MASASNITAPQFPGILPSQEPKASAALVRVRDLCPDLTEARQVAVAARIALWSSMGRTFSEAVEIAAHDAVWGSLGASVPVHVEQTSRDVLRFAEALKAPSRVETIPVLEPITATVRSSTRPAWADLQPQAEERAA
jgi:hypothetical protein